MKNVIAILTTAFLALASTLAAADSQKIYMALWRGITEAEEGFMDYLNAQSDLDIEFIISNAESNRENVALFVDDIKAQKPDLVYTFGTTVSLTVAGNQTDVNGADNITNIPVVFNIVADPVGANLVDAMNSSTGRNLTGSSHLVPIQTQLNAALELGDFQHLGVLYNATETNSQLQVENLKQAVSNLDVPLSFTEYAIDSEQDPQFAIGAAIRKARIDGVDVLYLPSDSFLIRNAEYISLSATAQKIPVFSATDGPVKEGYALAGLVSKYYLVGQFAGFKARQILTGQEAGDIPVETLTKFNTVVNLDVADALDYYPPVNLLLNATLYRQ